MVEVSDFAVIQAEFMARVSSAVYCSMATVDAKLRPRSRIVHPVWDGPVGWIISWPATPKFRQLAQNPQVSLAYIQDSKKPVYVDGRADWVDERAEKTRLWELIKATPPPLGYDPEPHFGTIDNPHFGLLRLIPWRIELYTLRGESIVWRQP
jgi:general stress protein 26